MLSNLIEKEGEFELKYTFPNFLAPAIDSWLNVKFQKDMKFPESRVQSIYLETQDTNSYQEKINSDFFKTKYRVRWYENQGMYDKTVLTDFPIYFEKKMKVGAKRFKQRWPSRSNLNKLKSNNLNSSFHRKLPDIISDNQSRSTPNLYPFVQISYIRKRFIDSFSGARFSLDFDIRIEKTNNLLLPPSKKIPLETGVFEVKSGQSDPPPSLEYLLQHIVKKGTFSKYEQCVSFLNI